MIICENPKHSLKLLNKLGIKKKLISLHDYNEKDVIRRLSSDLLSKNIALISDAGSPLISDPGYKLIQHCIKNNINVISIPGPSSIVPALQLCGFPINEFYFAGFVPKTKIQIAKFINKLKNIDKTSIFFVSNHKLEELLDMLELEIKDRQISISKELTKMNENVFRGYPNDLKKIIIENKENVKGEFVVVLNGKSPNKTKSFNMEEYKIEINKLLLKFSLTDVVEIVHKLTGINKNKVYKWVLDLKKS